jgi:hypothetical protein
MGEKKIACKFRWAKLKEDWKDIDGDGRIISKLILKK